MTNNLTQYWKKEYILLAVALLCLFLYYHRHNLKSKETTEIVQYLPIFGGLAFGINTLINVAK